MKKVLFILMLTPMLSGCALLNKAYTDPPPKVDPDTGEVVDPPPVLKPGVKAAIQLIGGATPVPWAGLAAAGVIQALTAYGSLRGKRWKQATISAVQAGNEFRQVAKQVAPDKYSEVKGRIIGNQNLDGTRKLIKGVLNALT